MRPIPAIACLLAPIALALSGCAPDQEVAESNQAISTPSHQHPPVGMLISDGHRIVIHTGPAGPLYSVKGPDGKPLASEITPEELQASFPDLNLGGLWAVQSERFDGYGIEGEVVLDENGEIEDGGFIHLESWKNTTRETEPAYPLIFEPFPAPRPITQPAILAE